MNKLSEIYSCIDGAEQQSRKGNLIEAINQYKEALKGLIYLNENVDAANHGVSEEVARALELLRQDIEKKTQDLEAFAETQKPAPSKASSIVGSLWNMTSSSLPGKTNTRLVDNTRNTGNSSTVLSMDPSLTSLINKLQSNLVLGLSQKSKTGEQLNSSVIELQVNQEIARFKKELVVYEKKKIKEHNLILEQTMRENKKLSNQIVKLRERWDSLVESAKQRRGRKEDD